MASSAIFGHLWHSLEFISNIIQYYLKACYIFPPINWIKSHLASSNFVCAKNFNLQHRQLLAAFFNNEPRLLVILIKQLSLPGKHLALRSCMGRCCKFGVSWLVPEIDCLAFVDNAMFNKIDIKILI